MVLETIISTADADGTTHFAPVGVILPDTATDGIFNPQCVSEFGLRLYAGSRTYENLRVRGEGVINLTDNVLYFADAGLRARCRRLPSERVRPCRLADAAGVWEFSVVAFDAALEPAAVTCRILCYSELAGAFALCRAHGAVLEAAVAVSRRRFLSKASIEDAWPGWRRIVEKTGGAREKEAFGLLTDCLLDEGFSLAREV